jgi:hypothetical protein
MDSPLHYLQLQHKTKEIYERDSKEQNGKAKSWVGGWVGGEMEMDTDISSDLGLLSQILVEK